MWKIISIICDAPAILKHQDVYNLGERTEIMYKKNEKFIKEKIVMWKIESAVVSLTGY